MMKKNSKKSSKKLSSRHVSDNEADDIESTDDDGAADEKAKRASSINYDEFVRVWRDAGSVSEVATTLKIKRNSASAIAGRLRKKGVTLRNMPRRGSQSIDVKHLNKIAAGKED